MTSTDLQAPDDAELLSLMMEDMNSAPDLYKPTNYWQYLECEILPYLKKNGLHNFRRKKDNIFSRFGTTDQIFPKTDVRLKQSRWLNNRISRKIPFWLDGLDATSRFLTKNLPQQPDYPDLSKENLWLLSLIYTKSPTPYGVRLCCLVLICDKPGTC